MRPRSETDGPERAVAGWLFGALFCFYVLIGGGHLYSPDSVVMYRVAASLLAGAADIQPLESWPTFGGVPFYDKDAEAPRFYAKYGLGQSLAAIPTLLVGRLLAPVVPTAERGLFDTPAGMGAPRPDAPFGDGNPFRLRWYDWSTEGWPVVFESWTASWTNAWVVAGIAAVLLLLGVELGFGIRPSLGMALLAGPDWRRRSPTTRRPSSRSRWPAWHSSRSCSCWCAQSAERGGPGCSPPRGSRSGSPS